MELTIAERYKKALIESSKNLLESKELFFENTKTSDPELIRKHFRDKLSFEQKILKYENSSSEELLQLAYESEKKELQKEIYNEICSTSKDPEKLKKLCELSSLSEAEFKKIIAENEERNAFNTKANVKSQKLIAELGLKKDKIYLSQHINGIFDPSVVGTIDEQDIPQIANEISSTKNFKLLKFLHKAGNESVYIGGFLKHITPIFLLSTSISAITNDEFLSSAHVVQTMAWLGATLVANKSPNYIKNKIHSEIDCLDIDLQNFIPERIQYKNNPYTNKNATPIEVEFEDVNSCEDNFENTPI